MFIPAKSSQSRSYGSFEAVTTGTSENNFGIPVSIIEKVKLTNILAFSRPGKGRNGKLSRS